jgi:leucyl-tRNA synthetase
MPQWAGSSWYYLRYIDPHNNEALVDPAKEKYFMPVDFYVGGAEHATRHLIYARFWHKFLYDLEVVSTVEPFTQLKHVGLILAEDGRKMSKRWNNVINPDEIVERFGADSMRLYEMFMSPFSQASSWNTQGVVGVRKFLEKAWGLQSRLTDREDIDVSYRTLLHQTIKKVGGDIDGFKLNTAVSAMMILVNKFNEFDLINKTDFALFVKILAPFAPHVAEEMWAGLGQTQSVFLSEWAVFDPELAKDEQVTIAVQINGKLRGELVIDAQVVQDKELVLEKAGELERVANALSDQAVKKSIYVPGKIVNFVV